MLNYSEYKKLAVTPRDEIFMALNATLRIRL